MRIAIVGAGAIGGFIAGALARTDTDVAVVARGPHLRAIQAQGLTIESDLGAFGVRLSASDRLSELGRFDALLLTFKAHQWPELLADIASAARAGAAVVTLQNGLPFWFVPQPPLQSVDPDGDIADALRGAAVLGGVVHVSGNVAAPGRIAQSGGLRYVLGDPDGGSPPVLHALAQTLRAAGLQPDVEGNLRAAVWLKLVNNVGLNAVSALRRMSIRPMLADPDARAATIELMEEAAEVGRALGAIDRVDLHERLAYAARLDDVETSMLQDLRRGRELELEPILGAVAELAERTGIAAPHVRDALERLRALQPRTRSNDG